MFQSAVGLGFGFRRGGQFAGGLNGNTGGLAGVGSGSPAARKGRLMPAPAAPSMQHKLRRALRFPLVTAAAPSSMRWRRGCPAAGAT